MLVLLPVIAISIIMQCVPSTSIALSNSYSLVGRSRAGDGTTFVIPELQWMFDCGALLDAGGSASRHPKVIFMTHTHSDHVFTLTQFTHSRELRNVKIYVPQPALPLVQDYLDSYGRLITMNHKDNNDDSNDDPDQPRYTLVGVSPGDEVTLRQAGKDFVVKIVECVHRIDCIGYSIWEQRHTLKPEYQGLPGREIGQLKKQGVEITTASLHPLLCYLGDTTAQVFDKHPELLRDHSRVVVECSFLDSDSQPNAVRTQHMHWFDLKPIVQAHPSTLFVVTHFSLKYSALLLRTFFNTEPNLMVTDEDSTTITTNNNNNVHPMLVLRELQDEWNAKRKRQPELYPGLEPPLCNCFVCQPTAAGATTV